MRATASSLLLVIVLFATVGCATRSFSPEDPASYPFLGRGITQSEGPVRVTAAVPDAAETSAAFGLPLYDKGIQPVWIELENTGSSPIRITIWSIDPDYYSPLEVAWMHRGGFSSDGKAEMERWFHDNALPRRIPAGESRSGFVYTHLSQGTKGFNLDAFNSNEDFNFTFFVPMPGFTADYMQVNFDELYSNTEIQQLTREQIRTAARSFACCSTDESGTGTGDPFNLLLISSGDNLRRALLRAGWDETEADSAVTVAARAQRYRGRRPDGTFEKSRSDGSERKELRLWLAPMLIDGERVWLGQASQELNASQVASDAYRIDPDIDQARDYVLQDFWYSQSVLRAGFTEGGETVSIDAPRDTFSGARYFTDGLRVVMWIADEPIGLDEADVLLWGNLDDE
jgi:hypothetical protein